MFTLQFRRLHTKMQGMYIRCIAKKVLQTLEHTPVVALLGPRQVGKTTLALDISKSHQSIYLDLESPKDLLKLDDPLEYLAAHQDKLIILDEVQRKPDLFMVLRGIIDERRREGQKGFQFLILGSASIDLLKQSSETLAGRISYIYMGGLIVSEVKPKNKQELDILWLRGGFPDSYTAQNESISIEWRQNFIKTYLEKDVPQLGFRIPADRLRRLWIMLSHLQGEAINYSTIAQSLEIDSKTVAYYLDILVDLLLVRRLEPWFANTKKRVTKSPRYYVRDSGILHSLLDINAYENLISNPINGKSWEGFVLENILASLPSRIKSYYYRTATGVEIDLLLQFSSEELWAIEIKKGLAPKIKPGFYSACIDLNVTKKFVVYSGDEKFSIANNTTVISLEKMLKELEQYNL